MKLLIVTDIHGDFTTLGAIMARATAEEPDAVLCPGNVTDLFKTSVDFSQLDIADLVIQKLLTLNKPVLCVPGNHDPFEILDIFDDYNINLHGKQKTLLGHHFVGFGGAKTPFNTIFEPTEEETAAVLGKLPTPSPTILLVHNPPKDTKLDALPTGEHVGSAAIRQFILDRRPQLAISAHIHEATGQDVLGPTALFNPGPAFQGRYGIVEIASGKVSCRLKTLKSSH